MGLTRKSTTPSMAKLRWVTSSWLSATSRSGAYWRLGRTYAGSSLATLILRLRGLEVTTLARTKPPTLNSELVEALGAQYVSTRRMPLKEAAREYGPFDIIFEATGASIIAFESMEVLGKNGVLVLTGMSGGDRMIEISGDHIMLGYKVAVGTVNANRTHFERGVQDMALAEAHYPGWLARLLTHPVQGLDNYQEMIRLLTEEKNAVKAFVEVNTHV